MSELRTSPEFHPSRAAPKGGCPDDAYVRPPRCRERGRGCRADTSQNGLSPSVIRVDNATGIVDVVNALDCECWSRLEDLNPLARGRRSFTSGLSQNGAGASRLTPLPPSSLRLRCRQGSSCCQLDVDDNRLAQPLCSGRIPAFFARTGWSVPVLRIGTLASWWSPLGLLPWHRSDRFPQFHMRARIRLAPPLRRSPSAPYPGVRRTDPRGSRSLWF